MEVNYDEEVEELNPRTWTSVLKPVEVEAVTVTGVGSVPFWLPHPHLNN